MSSDKSISPDILCRSARRRLTSVCLLLVASISLLTVSCRSGRDAALTKGDGYVPTGVTALDKAQLKELFDGLEGIYGEWTEMKVPVNLSLTSPKRFNIGGTLTMVRDRSVNLSLRFFGMEVASLTVTQDSVYALYKMDKIYFAESISDLFGGFQATVGNVQDLLLGRPFMLGEGRLNPSDCCLEGTDATWSITPSRSPSGMSYSFTVDTPTGNVELLTVNLPARAPITAEYTEFSTTSTGPVAGLTVISAPSGSGTFSGSLELNTRKAEWGSGYARSWSVPKGYTRVRLADIMKKIKDKT